VVTSDSSSGIRSAIGDASSPYQSPQRTSRREKKLHFCSQEMDELKQEDFITLTDMLEEENPTQDIELFVLSPGGNGEADYRIGHSFQQWAKQRNLVFRVVIPRYAMSAATILSLRATELVMGLQSEIGPIDPQIPKYDSSRGGWQYIPAMTVIDGLKLISEYLTNIPEMSSFFEEILKNAKLTLDDLGLLERARESGKQYGEALLKGAMLPDDKIARTTVERLSDYYKFHRHPIDAFEAKEELKLNIHYCQGSEWTKIKTIRDNYDTFVGQPGLIPGAAISSAIETVNLRQWRFLSLDEGGETVLMRSTPLSRLCSL